MTHVASIGECMIELRQAQGGSQAGSQGGLYSRGYGGDTLNTAVYLARLGIVVDYITALGDDSLSDEMIAGWAAEGVGTKRVARLSGKLPGLYMIQTDDKGERKFFHWRETAAARCLMDLPETEDLLNSLPTYDLVYLSAITLSLYSEDGRERLLAALRRARLLGTRFVFDTNFRARGWPDLDLARSAFSAAFEAADIVLASTEDLLPLYPNETSETLLAGISQPGGGAETRRARDHRAFCRHDDRSEGRAGDETRHRHHRSRRQFCGGLCCRAALGRRAGRGGARRPSSCRRRGVLSRRHHPALRHAAEENAPTRDFPQGIPMSATAKRQQLEMLFKEAKIIPVLTIDRLEDAVPLAQALVAGGVTTLEVTLRTPVGDRGGEGDHLRCA